MNLQAVIQDFLQCSDLTVQVIFSECNHNEYAVRIHYYKLCCVRHAIDTIYLLFNNIYIYISGGAKKMAQLLMKHNIKFAEQNSTKLYITIFQHVFNHIVNFQCNWTTNVALTVA